MANPKQRSKKVSWVSGRLVLSILTMYIKAFIKQSLMLEILLCSQFVYN